MMGGDSGGNYFLAFCQPIAITLVRLNFSQQEGRNKKVTVPTSLCEYWCGLGRSRRQGLAMPLGSCGRLVFQRAKHTLTKPGLSSLHQNQSYLALQEAVISVLREETGTKSFLYDTLLVIGLFLTCRNAWARGSYVDLQFSTSARCNDLPYHLLSCYRFHTTYFKRGAGAMRVVYRWE